MSDHPRILNPYRPPRQGESKYEGHARPAPEGCRMLISNTWDGEPSDRAERVAVSVKTVGDEVVVTVDAPFYGDKVLSSSP